MSNYPFNTFPCCIISEKTLVQIGELLILFFIDDILYFICLKIISDKQIFQRSLSRRKFSSGESFLWTFSIQFLPLVPWTQIFKFILINLYSRAPRQRLIFLSKPSIKENQSVNNLLVVENTVPSWHLNICIFLSFQLWSISWDRFIFNVNMIHDIQMPKSDSIIVEF